MPRKFKLKQPGRKFLTGTQTSCNWCRFQTRPDKRGLCRNCVRKFKLLLASHRWRTYSNIRYQDNPYCVECKKLITKQGSHCTHHTKPWRWFPDLFWSQEHHQDICRLCHLQHTNAHEGGGFNGKLDLMSILNDNPVPVSDDEGVG